MLENGMPGVERLRKRLRIAVVANFSRAAGTELARIPWRQRGTHQLDATPGMGYAIA